MWHFVLIRFIATKIETKIFALEFITVAVLEQSCFSAILSLALHDT